MGKCKAQNEMNSSEDETEKQQNCIPRSRAKTPQKYFLLLGELNGQKNEASLLGRPVEVSKHIAQYLLLCYSDTIISKQQGNPTSSSNNEQSNQSQHPKNLSPQTSTRPSDVPGSTEKHCRNVSVTRNNNNNSNNLKSPIAHKDDERCNPCKKFKSSPNDERGHGSLGRYDNRFVNGRALPNHKNRKNSHSAASPRYRSNLSPHQSPRKVSNERKNRRRMRSKSGSNSRSAKREKLSKTPRRKSSASASQKKSQPPPSSSVRTRSKSKQETNNALTKSKEKKTDVPPSNRKTTLDCDKTLVKTGNDNDESIKFASDIDDESDDYDDDDDENRKIVEKKLSKPRKTSNIYAKKGEKLDDGDLSRSRTFSSASGSNTKNCECHCRNCRFGSIQNKR